MGISGIFKELGPGQRQSIAKLSSDFYVQHNRCLRLAIDISIWLFQIQSGKGGSNPALRTFYYRLLRLLSLNIHPLFVFDGPNKPLYKRNKRVGAVQNGKGAFQKVASVPEFLAKQLLKQFGFPWHVAPGEAEAECALLQQEDVVDAVLSEDVDTIMFGCSLTLRNWTPEGTTKTPTHVNIYRAKDLKVSSGLDKDGMVLVALMSGGDYLPDGIPQCGIKLACDAARAGYGKDLCALKRSDRDGLKLWKERLEHQIRTNEAKYFSRKLKEFKLPEDFPNVEVLGWYTRPCVSSKERVEELRNQLRWDLDMDYAALRAFAGDAFDWRNLGGAKKFIKNLAPALLMREFRIRAEVGGQLSQESRAAEERDLVVAVHGKRNHASTDDELEYRISFTPMNLVPIDLSQEPDDDAFVPAGANDSDSEGEFAVIGSTPALGEDEPVSPRKRTARPYDPVQPEKLWALSTFLKIGCPLTVEDYEASMRDPKAFFKQRRQAKAAANGKGNAKAGQSKGVKSRKQNITSQANTLTQYATVTKYGVSSSDTFPASHQQTKPQPEQTETDRALKELSPCANSHFKSSISQGRAANDVPSEGTDEEVRPWKSKEQRSNRLYTFVIPGSLAPDLESDVTSGRDGTSFRPPSGHSTTGTRLSNGATAAEQARRALTSRENQSTYKGLVRQQTIPSARDSSKRSGFFAMFADPASRPISGSQTSVGEQRTPQKKRSKRKTPDLASPAGYRQESLFRYCSVTPRKQERGSVPIDTIDLVSSSPCKPSPQPSGILDSIERTPSFRNAVANSIQETITHEAETPPLDWAGVELPATVTKRRRRVPLRKSLSAPAASIAAFGTSPADDNVVFLTSSLLHPFEAQLHQLCPTEQRANGDDAYRPEAVSTSQHVNNANYDGGGFIVEQEDIITDVLNDSDSEATSGSRAVPPEIGEHAAEATYKHSTKPAPPAAIRQSSSLLGQKVYTTDVVQSRRSPRFPKQQQGMTAESRRSELLNRIPIDRSRGTTMKRSIVLRDSLEGAWKEVVQDSQLIGKKFDQGSRKMTKARAWSEVECLDLT